MKKLYFLFAVVFGLVAMNVGATTIYVSVDYPDRVDISLNYSLVELNDDNSLEFESDYSVNLKITSRSGYGLTSVIVDKYNQTISNGNSCTLYPNSGWDGQTIYVTTYDVAATRTASFTVDIDDSSKVTLQRNYSYEEVSLTSGETNTVMFNPETETPMILRTKSYGEPIYKVEVDGEEVSYNTNNGYYLLNVEDQSNVNIQANYPDEKYDVSISVEEDAADFVTRIAVDGSDIDKSEWENGKTFQVQAGSKVTVYGDVNQYTFRSMSVNGTVVATYMYSSGATFTVTKASVVTFDVTKIGTYTAYITIDDPENAVVYYGYNSSNALTLIAGEKTPFEFPNNQRYELSIDPADDAYIVSVLQNGNDVTGSYIYIYDQDEFVITTAKIVRDKQAVFYLNGTTALSYFAVVREIDTKRKDITSDLHEGYNLINFAESDNPFGISIYPYNATVYVNDESQTASYGSYQMSLADNDVVKIFGGEEPTKSNVSFSIGDGVKELTVVRDYLTAVDVTSTLSVHNGTIFRITPSNKCIIKVNDTELSSSEGYYEFTVDGDTTVSIEETDGVEAIEVSGDRPSGAVYNLQGIKVADNPESIGNLPAGLYIVGGKKIVVR